MFHREPLIAGSAARLEDLVTRIREVKIHSIYLRTKLATASTCLTLQATSVYTKKKSSVRNKLRLALACSLIFLLSTMASGPIFAQASPTTTSNGTCASSLISSGSQAAAASISQAQAKSASASSLAANDAGYNASFSSIFYRLGFTSSCSVYLENVNVVYVLVKGNAAVYTLEISLNPGPTAVLNTTEYPATSTGVQTGAGWSGYEYYNSGGISQSGASYNMPQASEAQSGQCYLSHCDFAFWVGETSAAGGSGGIAQTGTDSGI